MKNNFISKILPEEDFRPFVETMFLAAGKPIDDEFLEERKEAFISNRSIAAYSENKIVGTIATRPLEMTIPGGNKLPVAAIGQGGVLPSFTRQGIMRDLMTKSLNMAKDFGEAAAVWTTSEWPLYGRFGGGVSSFKAEYEISRTRVKMKNQNLPEGLTSLVALNEAKMAFPEIHSNSTSKIPGGVNRNYAYWDNIFRRIELGKSLDVLDTNSSFPPGLACLYQNPEGKYEGCIVFRVINSWEDGLSKSQIQVLLFVHTTIRAYISMWSFLLNFDLIETIYLPHRPINEPLRWLINDGRRLLTKAIYDHVWFRVLDPEQCLKNRRFPLSNLPIRIQITDEMGYAQTGTLEILSDGLTTDVRQVNIRPDIIMDVACFSSIFMGGISLWEFVNAGTIKVDSEASLINISSFFQSFTSPFTDTSF